MTAADVAYFSAAGNNNLVDSEGNDISSWEAPAFRDGACPGLLEATEGAEDCMDFDPAPGALNVDPTFGLRVSPDTQLLVDLQWAEPWFGVESDLDAYLLNSAGEPIASAKEDNVGDPAAGPLEILAWENTSASPRNVWLAIDRCTGECNPNANPSAEPPLKFAFVQNGAGVTATEYPESSGGDTVGPTIFGHNGAASGMSVGAVPFFDDEAPEEYSSRGPVKLYFEPVAGTTPAPPLGSPAVLEKPDLVATDGGANTFFGSCVAKTWRFFGTSAAAPHAAAVAALQRQAEPAASAEEVKLAQRSTALPVGAFGPEAGGFGLLDAVEAVAEVSGEPFPGASVVDALTPENCNLPTPPQPITPTPPGPNPPPGADETPPRTTIRRHPPKVLRTRRATARAVFRFAANEPRATFSCRIDAGRFRPCGARLVRRFRVGRHVLRVKAKDAAGNVDATPAVFRFKVRRTRPGA